MRWRLSSRTGTHGDGDRVQLLNGNPYPMWLQGELFRRLVENERRKRLLHPNWICEPEMHAVEFLLACDRMGTRAASRRGVCPRCGREFELYCPPHPEYDESEGR